MSKLDLLEIMFYKIDYEKFEKCWKIKGMPKRLEKKRNKCLKNLKQLEDKFSEGLCINIWFKNIKQYDIKLNLSKKIKNIKNKFNTRFSVESINEKINKSKQNIDIYTDKKHIEISNQLLKKMIKK
jgi:hypothetical protein